MCYLCVFVVDVFVFFVIECGEEGVEIGVVVVVLVKLYVGVC